VELAPPAVMGAVLNLLVKETAGVSLADAFGDKQNGPARSNSSKALGKKKKSSKFDFSERLEFLELEHLSISKEVQRQQNGLNSGSSMDPQQGCFSLSILSIRENQRMPSLGRGGALTKIYSYQGELIAMEEQITGLISKKKLQGGKKADKAIKRLEKQKAGIKTLQEKFQLLHEALDPTALAKTESLSDDQSPNSQTNLTRISEIEMKPLKPNHHILTPFQEVLQKGMRLKVHDGKKIRTCEIWIENSTLYWCPQPLLSCGTKKKKTTENQVDLFQVVTVESGKRTLKFQSPASLKAPEDSCLSLVCQDSNMTVDIQLEIKPQREAFVEGMNMLLTDLHESIEQPDI